MAEPEREIGSKGIGEMQFTDDERGEVRAIVGTLGVVDNDGDVLLPSTFPGEAKVKLSRYGHSAIAAHINRTGMPEEPPVGKGVLRKNANNELEFVGRYFMSTTRGRDAYLTAKEMGSEQEWSFTFWRDRGEKPTGEWESKGARRVFRNPIQAFEVSPVTLPGGVGTRTVGVKAAEAQADGDNGETLDLASKLDEVLKPLIEAGLVKAKGEMNEEERLILEGDPTAAEPLGVLDAGPAESAEAKAVREEAEAAAEAETKAAEVEAKRVQDLTATEFERFQRTKSALRWVA